MTKVFVRITGQLSTAISPVVGSISNVIVPSNLGPAMSPALGAMFERGVPVGDGNGAGT